MRLKLVILTVTALTLIGCAQQQQEKVWNKPNSSLQEFESDKFFCLQQSQQQASGSYVGGYKSGG